MILDATCSYAKVWPKTATVRIDIRPEVRPDIVMDNTKLLFPDAYFDRIYYDPPHIFRHSTIKKNAALYELFQRFGIWNSRQEFLDNLAGVNKEFYRCLKPSGELYCKFGVGKKSMCIPIDKILSMLTNFTIISHHTTVSKSHLKAKNPVHWLTMKPKLRNLALSEPSALDTTKNSILKVCQETLTSDTNSP
jgi:hypothetical protein